MGGKVWQLADKAIWTITTLLGVIIVLTFPYTLTLLVLKTQNLITTGWDTIIQLWIYLIFLDPILVLLIMIRTSINQDTLRESVNTKKGER